MAHSREGQHRANTTERATVQPRVGDTSSALAGRAKLGAVAGLVATVVMTVFRMPISRSPPPTAEFWATVVGSGEAEDYKLIGLGLHLGYGMTAGIVYGTLIPLDSGSEAMMESKNALAGTVFGVLLSLFGSRVLLERLLGQDLDADERLVFHLSHVIYGMTLGTWVGSRFGEE